MRGLPYVKKTSSNNSQVSYLDSAVLTDRAGELVRANEPAAAALGVIHDVPHSV